MYIDTHCHITDERYENKQTLLLDIFSKENLMDYVISVGYNLESSKASQRIAQQNSSVYFMAGVHPDSVLEYSLVENEIKKMLLDSKCVAVGEIGLDYHYEGYNKSLQQEVFENQIAISSEYNLPISVHSRDACFDTLSIIKANKQTLKHGGVMHCFSYSKETAKEYLDLGFYISFAGTVTYKNAKNVKEVAGYIPIDRLLVETDSPYLTPQKYRGQINNPKYVKYVVEEISKIRNITEIELSNKIQENAKRLFKKIK